MDAKLFYSLIDAFVSFHSKELEKCHQQASLEGFSYVSFPQSLKTSTQ
jgi:hypothetical protein